MRYTLTLVQRSEGGGTPAVVETPVATLSGALLGTGGTSPGFVADADYRFETRYVDGITPALVGYITVQGTTRKFHLRSVQDPDGRRRRLVILMRELVPGAARVA